MRSLTAPRRCRVSAGWQNRGYDPNAIATLFPGSVQEEIWLDMHRESVMRVPMFRVKGCDQFFVSLIVRQLRVSVLLLGDFAFRKGEVGDRMYFVEKGFVQIGTADRAVVFASKGPGTYVGELTLFNPGQRRSASAWSLSDCVLYTLSIASFSDVLKLFDKDGTLYEQMKHITQSEAQKQKAINTEQRGGRSSDVGVSTPRLPTPRLDAGSTSDGWHEDGGTAAQAASRHDGAKEGWQPLAWLRQRANAGSAQVHLALSTGKPWAEPGRLTA
jgi:hypothetical protein